MTLQVKKGSWTGNNTSPQAISAVGFQPLALIVWTTGPGATDVVTAHAIASIGFATRQGGSTQQATERHAYVDNVATSNGTSQITSAEMLNVLTSALGTDYTINLDSLDSDGFTVSYSSAANANGDVFHYLALGGSDLTDARVRAGVGTDWPTSGATFDLTGFGFQPDAAIVLSPGANGLHVGFIDTAGHECSIATVFTITDTMTSSMNQDGYFSQTSALSQLTNNADTLDALADFNSWLSDGIRFNNADAPSSQKPVAILGLKGGQYHVGSAAKSASSGAQTFGSLPFQPVAVLLIGADGVTAAATVTAATAGFTVGASSATDGSAEGCFMVAIGEAINTQSDRIQSTTKSIGFMTVGGPSTLQTAADMTAMGATSFELTWSAAGAAELVGYMVFGSTPVQKAPPPTLRRKQHYAINRRTA